MTLATLQSGLGTGLTNPVQSSQAVFRSVMNAMARPGSVHTIAEAVKAPSLMMPATAAVALALFDHDTTVWLDQDFTVEADMASWLRFQTGAPLTAEASQAAFALIAKGSALPDFETFAPGTPEYPDRSTTLVVQVETLTEGDEITLSGPGIQGTSSLRAGPLPQDFVARMQANRALFPLGVDLLLVNGSDVVALPRSIHVATKEV
jgi:alpha-D-ribose 1-methylphosphonate 5-triphosphate synthase subunit PhnH